MTDGEIKAVPGITCDHTEVILSTDTFFPFYGDNLCI